MENGLPKRERLNSKKEIALLLDKGETSFRHPLKLYCRKGNGCGFSRLMVAVPKKNFKRAVKRNLLKRRMREAYRLNKHILDGLEADLLFVYVSKEAEEYGNIEKRVRELLEGVVANSQKNG